MPFHTYALDNIDELAESVQVEFKLARGRDGQGKVPEDMWETYSAFANTIGGEIILGVRELNGQFTLEGIPKPDPMLEHLWQRFNDKRYISHNLLSPNDIQLISIQGKSLIRIRVPQAPLQYRPIYIGEDAYSGSYFRINDADMRASHEQVARMLLQAKTAQSSDDNSL
ncbi:helix-turn-helix domain-containing protein [Shewanella sp. NIFS-20-20]|uniref:AlbA family DNA-binding domain-containing protein n=1 Tax=Shewanella sp. NIFS-20-20 TaxID=2853806 RepID=UPI001C476DFC|nr:ATP-binding protein [Shewanella sp. NIFS-20-20]MBV7317260.1 ATP-binding protein [Shewanella sp. NIFS-20-20]